MSEDWEDHSLSSYTVYLIVRVGYDRERNHSRKKISPLLHDWLRVPKVLGSLVFAWNWIGFSLKSYFSDSFQVEGIRHLYCTFCTTAVDRLYAYFKWVNINVSIQLSNIGRCKSIPRENSLYIHVKDRVFAFVNFLIRRSDSMFFRNMDSYVNKKLYTYVSSPAQRLSLELLYLVQETAQSYLYIIVEITPRNLDKGVLVRKDSLFS